MEFRKVMIRKWIPKQHVPHDKNIRIAGTGCFEDGFNTPGLFHSWGCSYEEFESGPGNYTMGIVELTDGSVEAVLPQHIKFII